MRGGEVKVYISGPMTGLPEYNYPAFNAAEKELRDDGHEPINPARHGFIGGYEWADYMRLALVDLSRAEAIHLLDGWENSRGARLERLIANCLGIEEVK